jgi:hypothetical protein
LIVTLIDGKTAEIWKNPSREYRYSTLRYRVLRGGLLIGNGINQQRAIENANSLIAQMQMR